MRLHRTNAVAAVPRGFDRQREVGGDSSNRGAMLEQWASQGYTTSVTTLLPRAVARRTTVAARTSGEAAPASLTTAVELVSRNLASYRSAHRLHLAIDMATHCAGGGAKAANGACASAANFSIV